MEMEISEFIDQINVLDKRETEEKAWDMWISAYPHMGKNFIPFSEFLAQATHKKESGYYVDQLMF